MESVGAFDLDLFGMGSDPKSVFRLISKIRGGFLMPLDDQRSRFRPHDQRG